MSATDLWWSRTLLRIEDLAGRTIGLMDEDAIDRMYRCAERLMWTCRDEMTRRGRWSE